MPREWEKSIELFKEANRFIPGGVNSPVRAFRNVEGTPLFISRGKGSKIYDVDGNEYIDYVGSWGPLILGHTHPEVIKAIQQACEQGTSFGAPTEKETELSRLINEAFPSMELIRLVNSGTEAVMSVIRLARGFTGKDQIIKFEGCYHGHACGLLVKAGSGAATLGIPDSQGVPASYAQHTTVLPYNDTDALALCLREIGSSVAAVIVEPVAANMGLVLPEPSFLIALRELTTKYGIILIFDEIITGFRIALGGAQEYFGIKADLTCLGKIIGGGLPVGAYGGKREIMEKIAPLGPVYQAGTLSGNPIAVSAGIATIKELRKTGIYTTLAQKGEKLATAIKDMAKSSGLSLLVNQIGSLFSVFFGVKEVKNWNQVIKASKDAYKHYFWEMLKRGIYLAPSPYETGFISLAHSEDDLDYTIEKIKEVFSILKSHD